MKQNNFNKKRDLEDIEYEALASFLWRDIDLVKSIYKSYDFDGLSIILISNITLMYNKRLIGVEQIIRNMAKKYSNNKGNEIVNVLFGNRF